MTESTLISEDVLREHCEMEGIDFSQVCVMTPRWAESKSREEGARSALVRCDLIIRDDGSAVYLDGGMGRDSTELAQAHVKGESNLNNLLWDEFVESVTSMPE